MPAAISLIEWAAFLVSNPRNGPVFPVVSKVIRKLRSATGDDDIGSVRGPEHPRALQAETDNAPLAALSHPLPTLPKKGFYPAATPV